MKAALQLPHTTPGLVNCWISDIRECRNQSEGELRGLDPEQQLARWGVGTLCSWCCVQLAQMLSSHSWLGRPCLEACRGHLAVGVDRECILHARCGLRLGPCRAGVRDVVLQVADLSLSTACIVFIFERRGLDPEQQLARCGAGGHTHK